VSWVSAYLSHVGQGVVQRDEGPAKEETRCTGFKISSGTRPHGYSMAHDNVHIGFHNEILLAGDGWYPCIPSRLVKHRKWTVTLQVGLSTPSSLGTNRKL
jgi:hypothetical protein